MSEDKTGKQVADKPLYSVSVLPVDALTMRCQNEIYRKIYYEFIQQLDHLPEETSSKYYFVNDSHIEESIDTCCGRVNVSVCDERTLDFKFFTNPRLPKCTWRAGQLVHYALSSIGKNYKQSYIDFRLNDGKQAIDLVTLRVIASLGDDRTSLVLGAIPRHYANGKIISTSEEAISAVEQEVADDFFLKHNKGEIKFETSMAYAWHKNHGILRSFNEGHAPEGLKPRIIRSNTVYLRSGTSNA